MKKLMLICAPVTSRSGYGDHARDLVRAFLKLDKFDIKILDGFGKKLLGKFTTFSV